MRFFNVQRIARPQPWDRSPSVKVSATGIASLAPAGSTQRWSYTVPVNTKSFVSMAQINARVNAVATTGGLFNGWLQYTPNGGTGALILLAQCFNNALNASDDALLASGAVLQAGDQVTDNTSDTSVGGTVAHSAALVVTEFQS